MEERRSRGGVREEERRSREGVMEEEQKRCKGQERRSRGLRCKGGGDNGEGNPSSAPPYQEDQSINAALGLICLTF